MKGLILLVLSFTVFKVTGPHINNYVNPLVNMLNSVPRDPLVKHTVGSSNLLMLPVYLTIIINAINHTHIMFTKKQTIVERERGKKEEIT